MTNKITLDREREAFEAFMRSQDCSVKKTDCNNPIYFSRDVQGCWLTWQARAALAEQPQADAQPVAEVEHGPFDDVGEPQWVRVVTLGDFDLEHFPHGTKFYTHPAPAKVEPVPPAGGEVEVLHWQVAVGGYKSVQCETAERAEDTLKHFADRGRTVELVELVDRAHVTRLQAEVERARSKIETMRRMNNELHTENDTLRAQLADHNTADRLAVAALQRQINDLKGGLLGKYGAQTLQEVIDSLREDANGGTAASALMLDKAADMLEYLSASAEPSAPVAVVLAEARQWLGDGKHADGLAREHWTPEYVALIDSIDATLSKPPGARP